MSEEQKTTLPDFDEAGDPRGHCFDGPFAPAKASEVAATDTPQSETKPAPLPPPSKL